MSAEEKKNSFKGVRSMFLSNHVTKMKDIEDLNPTNIAKALKINHSRYIDKLRHPEEFAFKHIWQLSKLLDIDVQVIIDVIVKEISQSSKQTKRKPS